MFRRLLPTAAFLAILGASLGVVTADAAACDLCLAPPPEFKTLQSELEAAPTVLIAERSRAAAAARAGLTVRTVLRGGEGLTTGQRIDPASAPLGAGTFLIFGDPPKFDAIPARRLTDDVAAFLTLVAQAPEKNVEQPSAWGTWLAVMVPYLSDRDPIIATSAGFEFSEAPYSAVKAAATHLRADDLLHALEDRATPVRSRGALALLVGLTATEAHTERIEHLLMSERYRAAPSFSAVVAAFLMLRGDPGIAHVDTLLRERLALGDARTAVDVLAALRFHAQNEAVLTRAAILREIRSLMTEDAVAPAAVLELATLEDWDSLPLVMATFRRLKPQGPMILGPTARFVHDCPLPDAQAARDEVTNKKEDGLDGVREHGDSR